MTIINTFDSDLTVDVDKRRGTGPTVSFRLWSDTAPSPYITVTDVALDEFESWPTGRAAAAGEPLPRIAGPVRVTLPSMERDRVGATLVVADSATARELASILTRVAGRMDETYPDPATCDHTSAVADGLPGAGLFCLTCGMYGTANEMGATAATAGDVR